MTSIKAVLFDYDDTLVQTFPARVKAALKGADGILDPSLDLDRIMRDWAGRPQREIWKDLTSGLDAGRDGLHKRASKYCCLGRYTGSDQA